MTPPNSKEPGKQIALLRKAQGLFHADLAAASGVPITAIRRCEQNGRNCVRLPACRCVGTPTAPYPAHDARVPPTSRSVSVTLQPLRRNPV
jgi:hypothetical protein